MRLLFCCSAAAILIPRLCAPPGETDGLKDLILRFRSAPIELQVRGLLSLVEQGQTKGHLDEKALIEECFQRAAGAQRDLPLEMIGSAITEDPDYLVVRASRQGLDRLSLQSWAVRLMLPRDKAKARELFALMALPPYRRLSCADRLMDDPDRYYEALEGLLKIAFSAEDRADGLHLALIRAELSKVTSPFQLEPVVKRLTALDWTSAEYAQIVPAIGASLSNLRVDDRTFSAVARTLYGLIPRVEEFGLRARAAGVAADPIALGIRQFLAAHFPAERCADTAAAPKPPPEGVRMLPKPSHPQFEDESLPEVANYFNYKLRFAAYLPSTDLPPLVPEQMKPAKLLGGMEAKKLYWSNERQITLLAKQLLWVPTQDRHFTDQERATADWQRRAAEYRQAINDYRRTEGQPAESYFLHKVGLTMALWGLMPEGPVRVEVLTDVVRLLAGTDKYEVGLDLWVLGARDVLERARRGRLDRTVAPEVLEALRQSGDDVLALLAATPSYL